MTTTRKPEDPPDPEGFNPTQRSELEELIAKAVSGAKPPDAGGPPKVSDDDWDKMSDRQRESWVRQLVDFRLDELSRDEEIARQRSEIEQLKKDKTPEPERPPSVVTKIQRWLWGAEPDQA
jgi:hypothetical protein